jgi:hypothetical protein
MLSGATAFEISDIQEDEAKAQKFRLGSKLTDTMGKPANQPFSLYICIAA